MSFTYDFHVQIYIMCSMFLLYSIDLIFSLLKVSYLNCWPNVGPDILPDCVRCLVWFNSIIKMDVNMYLSKHIFTFAHHSPRWQSPGQPCLALIFSLSSCTLIHLMRKIDVLQWVHSSIQADFLIHMVTYSWLGRSA